VCWVLSCKAIAFLDVNNASCIRLMLQDEYARLKIIFWAEGVFATIDFTGQSYSL